MRFFTAAFVAVSAFAASVLAQENPISKPTVGSPVTAGQSFPIVWQPTTSGTITLLLRSGPANNLNTIATLVSGAPNSGSFAWTPSASLPAGSQYAIQIIDSAGNINYTPQFSIASDVKASSSSAVASSSSSAVASSSAAGYGSTALTSSAATSSAAASSVAASSSSAFVSSGVSYTVTQSYVTATITSCPAGCSGFTAVPTASIVSPPTYGNGTSNGTVIASTQTPKATVPAVGTATSSTGVAVATGAAVAISVARSPIALIAGVIGAALFL